MKYDLHSMTCTYCRYMGKKKLKQKNVNCFTFRMDARWCKLCRTTNFSFWQETHQALVRDGIINGESGNVPSATRLEELWVFPGCFLRRSEGLEMCRRMVHHSSAQQVLPVLWCVVRILHGTATWINYRGA